MELLGVGREDRAEGARPVVAEEAGADQDPCRGNRADLTVGTAQALDELRPEARDDEKRAELRTTTRRTAWPASGLITCLHRASPGSACIVLA